MPPTLAFSQRPDPAQNIAAMKKLDFLVGKWKGEAVIEMFPGQKQTISQTEDVQYQLDGTVLLIRGTGMEEGKKVFEAPAVLSFDARTQEYGLRAYRSEGMATDAYVKLLEKGFEWGFDVQGFMKFRYTLTLTENGKWFEIGEMKRGESDWRKFIELKLAKQE